MPRSSFEGDTLVDVLRHRAEASADAEHLVLLDDDDKSSPLSFIELLAGAEAVAGGLVSAGVEPADTVALMLPTGREFYFSFAGVLLAGAVPVPIYPPVKIDQIEEYAERQVGILRNAQAKALVSPRRATKLARLLRPKVPSMRAIVRPDRVVKSSAEIDLEGRSPRAGDLGLIQYTSGSTGDPKGVELTHANLLANIRSIGEAAEVSDDDVVVSWLPLYHDMGLIGCWLCSLCYGLKMISFSPLAFLRQPRRWLRAMSEYGGTLAAAPNFAYELCLRRVRDRDLEGLDLSKWRWALNGAEPVNPETIERFAERFGAVGFREATMAPVYGLAENAVALTFPPLGRPPLIEAVEREALEIEGRAVPAADEAADGSLLSVSVGRPIPGNEVRVVNTSGRPVPERVEGEIQFRGPSATRGYYRNPQATAAIRTDDGWTRTGDRGYFADGELYITGRLKDLIIKAGRNLDPAEVEVVAARVEGIRRGCVAAFGVPSPSTGSEDLVIVAETRAREAETRRRLASSVRKEVRSVLRLSPDAVVLVPPRTVPKTPSGKLRRGETRQRYLSNTLVQRRPPAWVQVLRLAAGAAGAAGAGVMAYLWRRRVRKRAEEEAE